MKSIKELRKSKGLTQKDVADYLGVKPSMVSRYENGVVTPPLSKLEALSELFGTPFIDMCAVLPDNTERPLVVPFEFVMPEISLQTTAQLYRRLLILAAGGKCELCKQPAPFKDNEGHPFLDIYVIDRPPVHENGEKNAVALCPNCYRRIEVLKRDSDITKLRKIAESHDF